MGKPKYTNTSLSFPDGELLNRAKARAARMGISFSKYVVLLIGKDIQERQAVGSVSDLVQPYRIGGTPPDINSESIPRRLAVDSEENLEAMAKLGAVAAGIQPRAKGESSPKSASTSGNKSVQSSLARRGSGAALNAPAPAPRQSAPAKPKPSSP